MPHLTAQCKNKLNLWSYVSDLPAYFATTENVTLTWKKCFGFPHPCSQILKSEWLLRFIMPNLQSFSLSNVSEHYFLLENEIYLWLVLTRNSSDQWSHKNYLHFHLQDPCEAARTDSWAPVDQTKVAPIPFHLVFHFKITIRNEKINPSTHAHVSLFDKRNCM